METVQLADEYVDRLIRSAFRQEDYAVKYAIEPLLNQRGPLSDLAVRLKLIYALGLISLGVYQDLEIYLELEEFLGRQVQDLRFGTPQVLERLDRLHGFMASNVPPLPEDTGTDPMLYQLQIERQEQVIRSLVLLCVSSTLAALAKESPI